MSKPHGLTTHGHTVGYTPTKTYSSWANMNARCYDKNNTAYPNYGAIGRVVCERWKSCFGNFLKDMGECPPKLTLERIDNKLNYSCGHCEECALNNWPTNCKWATRAEQSRNNRRTRLIAWNGKTQCHSDWAKEIGITESSLRERIQRGWPIERYLSR